MGQTKPTSILIILLTTGIISTLLSSLFTLTISLSSQKSLERLERIKRNYEIDSLRLQKLLDMYSKIVPQKDAVSFKDVDAILGFKEGAIEVIDKLAHFRQTEIKSYRMIAPLFDRDLQETIETAITNYYKTHTDLVAQRHLPPEQIDMKLLGPWFNAGFELCDVILANTEQQINRLQNPM